MSSENWKLEKDLCRCCHSEGSFKNLAEPRLTAGLAEIYADMLKECYNIDMAPVPGLLCAVTYTICEDCIIRLRDATDFKKQVLTCEERFRDMFNRNVIRAADAAIVIDVKQELPDTYQDDDFKEEFSQDDHGDDEYDESMDLKITEQADHKPEKEEGRRKKRKLKSKKTEKSKSCRRTERKKMKQETEEGNDGEKKKGRVVAPKFRLNEEDYKKDGDIYQCTRCDKTYDKIFSLKFHVKTKHYKIPRYTCSICMKEFMTPAPLTVHKLEAHNVDDRFKCKACKGTFNTKVQLRKHINNFHMLGERYKCEFCEYESFSFEGPAYYAITENKYHCNICGKTYSSQPLVSQHYRFVHLKRRPKDRKCPKCDERIPDYLRTAHLEKQHGIPAPTCGVCGKKFRFPCNVIQHQKKVHMGEKTAVCEVCEKRFFNKLSLRLHMSTHSDEKKFKCGTCDREFRWENNLKDHVRIHKGDKRFVCPVCEKAFVQKSTLKQHAARNHPGVDIA